LLIFFAKFCNRPIKGCTGFWLRQIRNPTIFSEIRPSSTLARRRGQGKGTCNQKKIKKSRKYFSGKCHEKIRAFSGKYYVKFGHFVDSSSCIYFRAKMSFPPKVANGCNTGLLGADGRTVDKWLGTEDGDGGVKQGQQEAH